MDNKSKLITSAKNGDFEDVKLLLKSSFDYCQSFKFRSTKWAS